jgi:hypothetical protein
MNMFICTFPRGGNAGRDRRLFEHGEIDQLRPSVEVQLSRTFDGCCAGHLARLLLRRVTVLSKNSPSALTISGFGRKAAPAALVRLTTYDPHSSKLAVVYNEDFVHKEPRIGAAWKKGAREARRVLLLQVMECMG